MSAEPILTVEHLTMRFGGLVAVDDLSFQRTARRDHRPHRPERRRQDHRVQLHHRLLQADRGHDPAGACRRLELSCSSACSISASPQHAQGRAHLPEHPAVPRHDRAGKPDRRAAQHADAASGFTFARPARPAVLSARRARGDRQGALLARPHRPDRARRRSRRQTSPMASSAGSKSRAPCAPIRCCSASTSRRPGSTRAKAPSSTSCCCPSATSMRTVDPADRARHERGDGDLRPYRRARLRREDRRRPAGRRSATTRR